MREAAQRIERIAKLVQHPSVSSAAPGWDQGNREVTQELADMLDGAGFEVELMPLPHAPHKVNLLASFGRGPGGLVIAGHTDTVPYDAARWTSDPFTLSERDGKLVGLGSADMKAFLALAVEAARGLDPNALEAPLFVLATADEETSMDGARALLSAQRPRARHAIIGEPTDMRPVRAHKGIMMEQLKVVGQTGHSSDPALGNNAIDGMFKVLDELSRFRAELATRYRNAGFSVPVPTLNFGRIQGGDSANRICGECALDIDLRLLPGMEMEFLRAELRRRAEDALAGTGLALLHETTFPGSPAHELAAEAAIVRAAEELTGEGALSVAFATEAPFLAALGADTLVLGPGGVAEAHRPDEFVRLERLEPTVRLLQELARRFCVGQTG
ncbi:MAG: acetylornithine deacetylase [Myxococcales bacterium]